MIRNYLKIALRNIIKHKLHSLINILGLAIAIACCLLLVLFIRDELSYDSFHNNKDRIFRTNFTFTRENTTHISARTPAPLGTALKLEFSEVEYVTRFLSSEYTLKHDENLFTEKTTFTDPDFLKMFSFNLIRGNPNEMLRDKNTIILSENIVRKYFGRGNPIGEMITLIRFGVSHDFTINGIITSPPENSSIQYDILIPFEKLRDFFGDDYLANWGVSSVRTYIQLFESSQDEEVISRLPKFIKKYIGASGTIYSLQSLSDVHFASTVQETMSPSSSMTYSYILGGITLLILLIAGFNSMNISTALASTRYKEIGVRKVMGAVRKQIIIQICGETVILSSIAFILGILLAELFLPTFNILAEKSLKLNYFENWYSFALAVVFIGVMGLLSGIFPSVLLSKYPPVDLYQRKQIIGGRSSYSRSSIMIQFGLSIFLIVCTLVMSNQLNYLKTCNLGFNNDQIVVIPYRGENSQETLDTYRSELSRYAFVLNSSGAYSYPGGSYHTANATSANTTISINHIKVDYDFLETFGIKLKEGRNFSRNILSDTTRAIIIVSIRN
ncbi:putative ABC transport system permease protein [Candidatus Methanophagaceae archaeon]|nr:putative ABC transport system permease protein [Methanophagales archaeon]